jgi:hypothetical protein
MSILSLSMVGPHLMCTLMLAVPHHSHRVKAHDPRMPYSCART